MMQRVQDFLANAPNGREVERALGPMGSSNRGAEDDLGRPAASSTERVVLVDPVHLTPLARPQCRSSPVPTLPLDKQPLLDRLFSSPHKGPPRKRHPIVRLASFPGSYLLLNWEAEHVPAQHIPASFLPLDRIQGSQSFTSPANDHGRDRKTRG